MNGNKKLGFLGLITIFTVYSIFYGAFSGSGFSQAEIHGSKLIDINYFPQKDTYYCGQASVQMVLYQLGKPVSQYDLANEMNYIDGAGTRNIYMVGPFQKRGVDIVSVGIFSNENHLRSSVDKGQYSIINIKFDQKSKSFHYVVVTGYNETGFFLHDPWPESWGKPEGRQSGHDVYISNELLGKLWAYRLWWVLTAAATSSVSHSTTVIVEANQL